MKKKSLGVLALLLIGFFGIFTFSAQAMPADQGDEFTSIEHPTFGTLFYPEDWRIMDDTAIAFSLESPDELSIMGWLIWDQEDGPWDTPDDLIDSYFENEGVSPTPLADRMLCGVDGRESQAVYENGAREYVMVASLPENPDQYVMFYLLTGLEPPDPAVEQYTTAANLCLFPGVEIEATPSEPPPPTLTPTLPPEAQTTLPAESTQPPPPPGGQEPTSAPGDISDLSQTLIEYLKDPAICTPVVGGVIIVVIGFWLFSRRSRRSRRE